MRASLHKVWERVSLYLPVILMGVLALGTYWLVRSTPIVSAPAADLPASHDPDYLMRNFSVRTFDTGGQLKSEILGQQARHFPDRDLLEIDQVRIRSFDASARLTTASAKRALTDGEGSRVQLFGDAQVIQEAQAGRQRMAFQGEHLEADLKAQWIRSDRPVELLRGQDRFTADALAFDKREGALVLTGRVRGILIPAPRP